MSYLDQNWSSSTRQHFYTTTQGSRIMPYAWLLALEKPGDTSRFLDDSLARYGFLPNPRGGCNPDGLPVGFVKDKGKREGKREDFVGMNCAACHTGQIKYGGKVLQIDGAPTQADMFGFLSGLDDSLKATVSQSDKFDRFASNVLQGAVSNSAEKDRLKTALQGFSTQWSAYVKHGTPKVPWGHGRLDAFGLIFNRVTAIDLGIEDNNREPSAPVSYPFLWGTSWHNVVQWNGAAKNTEPFLRLARNVGEVLGVFAQADAGQSGDKILSVKSSARRINMLLLEADLKKLRSPQWPKDVFDPREHGGGDHKGNWAEGEKLFNVYCYSCHQARPRSEQNTPLNVNLTPVQIIGTDPTMATNAALRSARTGRIEGARLPLPGFSEALPAKTNAGTVVAYVTAGTILGHSVDWRLNLPQFTWWAPSDVRALIASIKAAESRSSPPPTIADGPLQKGALRYLQGSGAKPQVDAGTQPAVYYKGRPLDGIWATGPYLHNGSVPNLYEILLPASQRSKKFYVGRTDFDPIRVGFVSTPGDGVSLFDTSLPGNSNAGHDKYGNDEFSDQDRWDLVEYMKSL